MSAPDDVRKASKTFYGALNAMLNGDAGPLTTIWSHGAAVTTLHPVGGRQVGWPEVGGTWRQVATAMARGEVCLVDQLVRVVGDLAYEVGREQGRAMLGGTEVAIDHRVTNVYRREANGWRIVHHHADVSPAMQEALARLTAK